MKKKYKHIIWDWNGTLLDDIWLCVDEINRVLAKYKKPLLSLNQYRDIFDFPVKDYYKKIGFDFNDVSFEVVGSDFIAGYNQRHFECELREGACRIVKLFSKNKISQSILSARRLKSLLEEVSYYKLSPFIENVCGLNHHYATSKIEIGKDLLNGINISSQEILLIGDTTHDFETSKELETDCILVKNGHQSHSKLVRCDVPILDSLNDLEQYIIIE
jgi:phosphoglycolate phosphatase